MLLVARWERGKLSPHATMRCVVASLITNTVAGSLLWTLRKRKLAIRICGDGLQTDRGPKARKNPMRAIPLIAVLIFFSAGSIFAQAEHEAAAEAGAKPPEIIELQIPAG